MQVILDTNILSRLIHSSDNALHDQLQKSLKIVTRTQLKKQHFTLLSLGLFEVLGLKLEHLSLPPSPGVCAADMTPNGREEFLDDCIKYYLYHQELSEMAFRARVAERRKHVANHPTAKHLFHVCVDGPGKEPRFLEQVCRSLGAHAFQVLSVRDINDVYSALIFLLIRFAKQSLNITFYHCAEKLFPMLKHIARSQNLDPEVKKAVNSAHLPTLNDQTDLLDRELFQALCMGIWSAGSRQKALIFTCEKPDTFAEHIEYCWRIYGDTFKQLKSIEPSLALSMCPGEIVFCDQALKVKDRRRMRDIVG